MGGESYRVQRKYKQKRDEITIIRCPTFDPNHSYANNSRRQILYARPRETPKLKQRSSSTKSEQSELHQALAQLAAACAPASVFDFLAGSSLAGVVAFRLGAAPAALWVAAGFAGAAFFSVDLVSALAGFVLEMVGDVDFFTLDAAAATFFFVLSFALVTALAVDACVEERADRRVGAADDVFLTAMERFNHGRRNRRAWRRRPGERLWIMFVKWRAW
jgi:hypothetical protein